MDEQGGLFAQAAYQPLAERVRPRTLDDRSISWGRGRYCAASLRVTESPR